jgi:hypothetical protein
MRIVKKDAIIVSMLLVNFKDKTLYWKASDTLEIKGDWIKEHNPNPCLTCPSYKDGNCMVYSTELLCHTFSRYAGFSSCLEELGKI